MRCLVLAAVSVSIGWALVGCTGSGISSGASYNPGYGPFDAEGNYVEEWADKPAKKHWWAHSTPATKPTPAKREQPGQPPEIASASTGARRAASRPGPARPTVSRSTVSRPPGPEPASRPAVTDASAPKPAPVASAPPKPKPKPEPVKAKPKKPAPIRHKVSKGDTLWALSRRYGTSVSSIQRANGLSGSNIRIGQTLLIPR